MNRIIDLHLEEWMRSPNRLPLLLRGARQVGKTFAARKLGETFETYIEINFEKQPKFKKLFEEDLDPKRIIRLISVEFNKEIIPGKTLIFFDEIQEASNALTSLRYFYEEMPMLHVLAAGSLLSLAMEAEGVPVGRVSFFHIYPMSLLEFLKANEQDKLMNYIIESNVNTPLDSFIHNKILSLLADYFVTGGMPAVVKCWIETKDPLACFRIQQSIIDTYIHDFPKYVKKSQIKYVDLLFSQIPLQLGQLFKFHHIPGEYRKRELFPALELLVDVHIAHKIHYSGGQGIPLKAQIDLDKFKTILLDIGLTQKILGATMTNWFLNPTENFLNKGPLTEAFIGQEILAYLDPFEENALYYWHREEKNSQAEIDYLISSSPKILPIEVKSNKGNTLRSIKSFLDTHPKSNVGIRFSTHNFSKHENILSYPLYAVATFLKEHSFFITGSF